MNLHQYRVLKAMAAKPTTTDEEQEAIEGAIDGGWKRFEEAQALRLAKELESEQ